MILLILVSSKYVLILLTVAIFGGIVNPIFAVQMEASVSTPLNAASITYGGDKILTLKYPIGSPMSKLLNGKKDVVSFSLSSTDPNNGVQPILTSVNNILSNQKSQAHFVNATLDYKATINGGPDLATISYNVQLKPYLTGLVTSTKGSTSDTVSLDWRSFSINTPLYVTTPKYGKIDINHPSGALDKLIPGLASKLSNPSFAEFLNQPILDFSAFGASMDNWHFLFDATGSQAGAAGFGFSVGKGGSKIISIYSLGESSFREGSYSAKEGDTSATVDGVNVGMHTLTPPPSGQIQVGGFSKIQKIGDTQYLIVSAVAPQGIVTSSGGFPIFVLLVFGGMMGGVAIIVLIKARK